MPTHDDRILRTHLVIKIPDCRENGTLMPLPIRVVRKFGYPDGSHIATMLAYLKLFLSEKISEVEVPMVRVAHGGGAPPLGDSLLRSLARLSRFALAE